MQQKVLVTTLGANPQRVLDLIYDLSPNKIFLLNSEKDPRWGKDNPQFLRDVVDLFEGDPLIKSFRTKGKIVDVPVQTISKREVVFHEVFRICNQFERGDRVYLDRTGMAAPVTVAIENVACCFRHVTVVYETSKSPQSYSTKVYGRGVKEPGDKMVEIPTPRVDLRKIRTDGFPRQVFEACYDLAKSKIENGKEPVFQAKDVFQTFSKQNESSKNLRIKITQNLNSFFSDGFLDEEPFTGKAFKMTLFAISLGEELFEQKEKTATHTRSDQASSKKS